MVAKFSDATGREWQIAITAGDLKRLKRDTGVDLRDALKPHGGKLTEVLDDPERFLDLMWALCDKQVRGEIVVSREEFECLFDRDTTVGAVAAVWEAVWDFSHGQKAGTEARKALLAASDEIESATARVLRAATDRIKRGPISSDSASATPELPESTTDPSPSVS